MQAGQTLIGTNGKQVLLWPMPVVQVNQLPFDYYSHCCQASIDTNSNTAYGPIYAPCDCHLIYAGSWGEGMPRIWASDDEVNYATGVGYVWFEFGHDSNPIYNTVGTHVKQGQLIGHTGTSGGVADHCHLTVGLGQTTGYVSSGYGCVYQSTCFYLSGQKRPEEMWFINDTPIWSTLGLNFKTYEGGTPGPGPGPETGKRKGMPLWMYLRKPF